MQDEIVQPSIEQGLDSFEAALLALLTERRRYFEHVGLLPVPPGGSPVFGLLPASEGQRPQVQIEEPSPEP
jgi:hypothetical protein